MFCGTQHCVPKCFTDLEHDLTVQRSERNTPIVIMVLRLPKPLSLTDFEFGRNAQFWKCSPLFKKLPSFNLLKKDPEINTGNNLL